MKPVAPRKRSTLSNYEFKRMLGEGTYGQVVAAQVSDWRSLNMCAHLRARVLDGE